MKNSKVFYALMAALLFIAVFMGYSFAKSMGLLKKYPKPKYLTYEEESIRPAYRTLSKKEQAIYEALYRGITDHRKEIALPYDVSGDTYNKVFCMVEKQEGRLFQLDSVYYTANKVRNAQIVYRVDKEEYESMRTELDEAVRKATLDVSVNANDFDKVMRIHDYLVRNCKYIESDETGLSSTSYGCLVNKKANCEGYAKAFNVLCEKAGLQTVLITGVAEGENHAWNQVLVSGNWYNIDVTWDDTDVGGDMRRMYYLCDDDEFYKTHMPDEESFEPFPCKGEKGGGSYYKMNGHFAETMDDAREIILRELKAGSSEIDIKLATEELYDRFRKEYVEDQKVFGLIYEAGRDDSSGMTISVRENRPELHITLILT
ncbi:MAG: hypothetical protein GXY08_10930 [Ruminococcus sp.]|nr:hypothetical protein [Ruminococcus sp.]